MKTKIAAFLLGIIAIVGLAFVTTQGDGIYILNSVDQTQFKVRGPAGQTAPFLEFVKGGTNVFTVGADGTVSPAIATLGGFGTAAYSNATAFLKAGAATTNTAGDMTLEGTSTFLQFNATGSGTGFRYYDLYSGGSTFNLRRKADNGGSVLANIFTLTNDVFTFGVPIGGNGAGLTNLTFNQQQFIPTNTIPASSTLLTNYVLVNLTNTIGGGGPTFVATNIAAAGSFLLGRPAITTTAWP